jgi:hypothetical protein
MSQEIPRTVVTVFFKETNRTYDFCNEREKDEFNFYDEDN